jgi:hypothetical protein
MGLALVLVGGAACGGAPAGVAEPHVAGRNALLDAANDPAAIEELFRGDVVDGGLWFGAGPCAPFRDARQVPRAQLSAFAHCLAGLHLQASPREDALGDVVVMTYAPGIEIEARVIPEARGPHLSWIGYESRRAIDALIPTVTTTALESVRVSGKPNGPLDPAVATTLELDATKTAHAWLRVCVDETGAVTLAHPFVSTSLRASDAFHDVALRWTFKPFAIDGAVVPICSMVRMSYPAAPANTVETLPLPPPRSRVSNHEAIVFTEHATIAPTGVKLVAGNKFISPDGDTKTLIQQSNVGRVIGSFRVCADETGAPESVLPLRSTRFARYDRRIIGTIMQTWRYAPFEVHGQAAPFCTAITFIYSQR